MRKLLMAVSVKLVLWYFSIFILLVFGNIPAVKAEEPLTVEGVWLQVSASSPALERFNGKRRSITKTVGGYEVSWTDNTNFTTYTGSPTRIVYTYLEDLVEPNEVHGGGSTIPEKVKQQAPKQKIPLNVSYTLSADGNYLTREEDAKWLNWDGQQNFTNYEIKSGYYKSTFKRISVPAKAENRVEKAYQANCEVVDPNRTKPFPPDHEFCPGNLVCMTNFCGGGIGCPYVCCPKGLPYLNHCDCKCYATSDFDCHSYSYGREKLLR